MSSQFQCPSCMRALQFSSGDSAFQNCPFCKGKIIVPSTAVHQEELEEQKPTEYALLEHKNLKLAQIQNELNAGRKINAIKLFREAFGVDLRDAKEAVETLEWEGKVEIPDTILKKSHSSEQQYPTNQQIYQDAPKKLANAKKSGASIFWILISIGIFLYFIFAD